MYWWADGRSMYNGNNKTVIINSEVNLTIKSPIDLRMERYLSYLLGYGNKAEIKWTKTGKEIPK